MDMNRYSDRDRIPGSVAKSTPDHWVLFLAEGVVLILLGLLAIAIPSIANENVTGILGVGEQFISCHGGVADG